MILRQLRFELIKLFAHKRTYIGYVAFIVMQVGLLALLQLPKARGAVETVLNRNGFPFEPFYGGLTLAVFVIVFSFMLLGALYLALVAGDIVAKEVEDGTMRLILARPISRVRLLLIKWIACTIYTWTLIAFLVTSALITASLYRMQLGRLFVYFPEQGVFGVFDTGEGLVRYLIAALLMTLTTQTIANLALMFSSMPVKPAAATVLTLSVFFLDLVLRSIPYFEDYRHWFITHHTGCWMRSFAQPAQWWDIATSLAFLAGLNLTFVVVAVLVFSTRDIKQ